MMKFFTLLFIFVLFSCSTYRKTTVVNEWVDKYNIQYKVYQYSYYDRRNDSLCGYTLDTVRYDPKYVESSKKETVKNSKKLNMDQQF